MGSTHVKESGRVMITIYRKEGEAKEWRDLGLIEMGIGITVGRIGAIPVIRPESMNPEICCWLSSRWIAATLFCITV